MIQTARYKILLLSYTTKSITKRFKWEQRRPNPHRTLKQRHLDIDTKNTILFYRKTRS